MKAQSQTQGQQEESPQLTYKYIFTLKDGQKKEFKVALDRKTLEIANLKPASAPAWADLSNRKCTNCPLKESESPKCPAAAALALSGVVDTFGSAVSHDDVHVAVETEQRNFEKYVPLQKGLSGLIGLLMVTSGCPIMKKLRPLVRYHMPFSNLDETQFRILAMYLMAQHLRNRKGKTPDWALKNLGSMYKEIQEVNQCFVSRLLTVVKGDAGPNALVILNAFADAVTFSVEGKMLGELEEIFQSHLE
ncbi:MAG: hypothetical protein HYZ95_02550 [Candidatus Omnitrophica bacterium]|nr:hypothetical protein [Candidatus Omnitrophota bacterium]